MKNLNKLFLSILIVGSFLSCLTAADDTIGKFNTEETPTDQNEMYLLVHKLLPEIKIDLERIRDLEMEHIEASKRIAKI